jgi:hypothetical protein
MTEKPMNTDALPLLQHALESPSAFTPERLMDAVRTERGLAPEAVPPLCVLDFDGDLSDHLAETGLSTPLTSWACFHTSMRVLTLDGLVCGIVPRTIGGPYAVLVAEQLRGAGARVIVGLTSAGRVSPSLPLPSIVVIDEAVRDEGTSLHYLPPGASVETPSPRLVDVMVRELGALSRPCEQRDSVDNGCPVPRNTRPASNVGRARRAWRRDASRVTLRVRARAGCASRHGRAREQCG